MIQRIKMEYSIWFWKKQEEREKTRRRVNEREKEEKYIMTKTRRRQYRVSEDNIGKRIIIKKFHFLLDFIYHLS